MINEPAQLFFPNKIEAEKPNAKAFYKFIATFEALTCPNQAIINSHIRMTLVKQPPQQDLSIIKPKEKVLIFAQVVEENKHIEGQIRKITLEQALRFQNLLKKLNQQNSENFGRNDNKNKMIDSEDEKKMKITIFGTRNGGLYQHF